jgi:hypothetical protein
MVLGLCVRVLSAWPTYDDNVAVLIYPLFGPRIDPRFPVNIVAEVPAVCAPILHNDCRNTDDKDESSDLISYVCDENVLIVEGREFRIGPPAIVIDESISVHTAVPMLSVINIRLAGILVSVTGSTAYTLRSTISVIPSAILFFTQNL